MPGTLTEIAPGVLITTAVPYTTISTVVAAPDGGCLLIDPAVTVDEITALADALDARGLRPVAGWSTHPHWDHLLWHRRLGDVPRYAAPAALPEAGRYHERHLAAISREAPGHDPDLVGKVIPLAAGTIGWDGPAAQLIVHNGHAPGHGAVFLPDTGVLIAGDMCSDMEIPLLDLESGDPAGDYRAGLSRLAALPVRHIVPGHGHVGDAAEFASRTSLDVAYLDNLERGADFTDPRITAGWYRRIHDSHLAYVRDRTS
jgi:hydroxyacylglutathione hydrolase